jgi:hypothetical protein
MNDWYGSALAKVLDQFTMSPLEKNNVCAGLNPQTTASSHTGTWPSNPTQGGQRSQVFAMTSAHVISLGDLVNPISTITLGCPIRKPANEVWSILERWIEPGKSPLNWS